MSNLSPMMRQYMEIKEKHKGHVLFFRLGDFYEMFFEDAVTVSKELELTLTGRDCGLSERAPMCGIPYHSCDSYIKRLLDKGYKVAICEQMENPNAKKGIVKREVVRVVTPGTIIDGSMLDEAKNNYICSVYVVKDSFGISFADISTGEVYITGFESENIDQLIINEFVKFSPSEVLFNNDFTFLKSTNKFIKNRLMCVAELIDDNKCDYDMNVNHITEHFKENIEDIREIFDNIPLTISLGFLINYLNVTQKQGSKRIIKVNRYENDQFLYLDLNARRNLELTENIRTKEKKGSLLYVLDKTKTAMGKRLIRKFIEQPLMNIVEINNRQDSVKELFNQSVKRMEIISFLDGIYDLERLMTKLVYRSINPRELKSLAYTAKNLPSIKDLIMPFNSSILKQIYDNIYTLEDIKSLVENAIVDEPPVSLKDGGVIKEGFNSDLDEYKSLFKDSKLYISNIEKEEREKTGIKNLKISYNKVFGYYIEVTKSYLNLVPENYIRKQTLANCERFITQELKDLESKILYATERMVTLEQEIFNDIIKFIANKINVIQKTAGAIALLDVISCLADVAVKNNYICPKLSLDSNISIVDGRHPVVEKMLDNSLFVPNDTLLDVDKNKVIIITGPNMAGKSTYMRQVAIITIMAQIGSFVPAKSAEIGIVDKIFTRVGASDDLSSGNSTFMVEMSEVADILSSATSNSLIILDEIGRGTSTFDGMSIAKSVIEYIVIAKHLGAKTLFATHYHELTELEKVFSSVKNYNIVVKKNGDDITFLRKIVRGGADESYGIEVAKLAGVPNDVVTRAKEILYDLENFSNIKDISNNDSSEKKINNNIEDSQSLYFNESDIKILNRIKKIDIDVLTPIEALNILYEIKKLL